MDKSKAIEILTKVTEQLKLTRSDHLLVQQALETLAPVEEPKQDAEEN